MAAAAAVVGATTTPDGGGYPQQQRVQRSDSKLGIDGPDAASSHQPPPQQLGASPPATAAAVGQESCSEATQGVRSEAAGGLISLSSLTEYLSELFEAFASRPSDRDARQLVEDARAELVAANKKAVELEKAGKYKAAEKVGRLVLDCRRVGLGSQHPSTLITIGNLARTLFKLRKYQEAEQLGREALNGCRAVKGSQHSLTVTTMNILALTLDRVGKYEEVEELQREALGTARAALDSQHPDILYRMAKLAVTLEKVGKHEKAEKLWIEVCDGRRIVLGSQHPSTLESERSLARTQQKAKKAEEAGSLSEAAKLARSLADDGLLLHSTQDLQATMIKTCSRRTIDMLSLAVELRRAGRYEEAATLEREAIVDASGTTSSLDEANDEVRQNSASSSQVLRFSNARDDHPFWSFV